MDQLLSVISSSYSKEDINKAEKMMNGLEFQEFKECFFTQLLEGLPIEELDGIVDDLQAEVSLTDAQKRKIVIGKKCAVNDKRSLEFLHKPSGKDTVFFGRTLTKRQSNSEITFACIFHRVDFRLLPRQSFLQKIPILGYLFSPSSSDDKERPVNSHEEECLKMYFSMKCADYLSKEYPEKAASKTLKD